jgi:hypothetical protein
LAIDSIKHTSTSLSTREVSTKIRIDLLNYYKYEQEKKPVLENKGHFLDGAILAITRHLNNQPNNSNKTQNKLIFDQYERVLNNFFEYIEVYDTLEDKREQLLESFYKIFAVIAGANIASYYIHEASTSDLDNEIVSIDAELSAGV